MITPNQESYIHNFPKYFGCAFILIIINIIYAYIINISTVKTVDIINIMDIKMLILLLPAMLLIEEFMTRGIIYRLTKGTLTNNIAFFCILYILADVHMVLHYTNLITPTTIDILKYFSVQFINGLFLGYVILKYGFKGSYTVHLLYDFIIIFMTVMLPTIFGVV